MGEVFHDTSNRGIFINKLLHSPINLVWEAWTEPELITMWWGPNGFKTVIHKMDFTEGGEWHLTMQDVDGKHYPNKSIFLEIVPQSKIVFQHFNPNYVATISFEPKENKTLMHWTLLFETIDLFETVVKVFKADEGLKQNVDKLENYLKTKTT